MDRHGVYGLQRNLLVENIIDMYKQQTASPAAQEKKVCEQVPMCEVHMEEKINIYCVTCATPTCSMCKVFGVHKECQVAPLTSVYNNQKTELTDRIAMMVSSNERVQGIISQLEETCRIIEVNGRKAKSCVCEKFDHLYAVLEERKQELSAHITEEQEEKLGYIQTLQRRYKEHQEALAKLMDTGVQTMEEPDMAVFLQTAKPLLKKISEMSDTSHLEKVEVGYENMDHFQVHFLKERRALRSLDFIQDEEEEEEEELDQEEGADHKEEEPAVIGQDSQATSLQGQTSTKAPVST